MTDNVTYQAGTLATPGTNTVVATDYVGTGGGGSAHFQRMKLDIGPDGTTVPLAWGGTGLPLGTLPGGSVGVVGTVQGLGTVQPLAGSVHLASGLPGTVQVLGSVRILDPAAVSQSGAWSISGTVQVLGSVQTVGTSQVLGTVRVLDPVDVTPTSPAANDYLPVRLTDGNAFYTASGGGGGGGGIAYSDESPFAAGGSQYTPIGGFVTSDAVPSGSAGAVAMTTGRALHVSVQGTAQVLGTVQPLAGSVHLASGLPGTVQVLGSIQAHGTTQILGTVRALLDAGTVQVLGTVQAHGTTQVLGTVAIASVGTLAASLAKREDTVHADGDVGVMILGVRRDEAVTAAADGEYTAISTDSAGRMRVNTGPDLVDDANSSTTPLAGGATFTGTGIEMTEYASIVVSAFANVASATDGLQIQFSQDNTNWDNTFAATVSASTATSLRQGAIARYVRVVYTNGASAQATFRLQAILKGSPLSLSGKPISENLASTDLSATTKSVLAGRIDGGSTYRNVETTNTTPTASAVALITRTAGTPQFLGTVQAHGTTQALGTVRALIDAGTVQVLGTIQAHGTTQALGTVSVQGYAAHDAAVTGNPILNGAFGSSGAPTAVTEQDAVRLWADLNGRLQVVGSVTAAPIGTQQVLGTIQSHGTNQALGTVQAHGTTHVLGSVSLLGAGTLQGGTVRTLPPTGTALGETYFSTVVTGGQSAVTYVAAPGAGTFIRVYDILISGSAAGTARLLDNAEGTHIGHIHAAANGGWSFNSSRGVRTRAANRLLAFSCSAGTWGLLINYALET